MHSLLIDSDVACQVCHLAVTERRSAVPFLTDAVPQPKATMLKNILYYGKQHVSKIRRSQMWDECAVEANVIAGRNPDVVRSNKCVNNPASSEGIRQ